MRTFKVNPKYNHFALRISDMKIVNGWDSELSIKDAKEYEDMDLKDMFPENKRSDFKILTPEYLKRQYNINAFDWNFWSN